MDKSRIEEYLGKYKLMTELPKHNTAIEAALNKAMTEFAKSCVTKRMSEEEIIRYMLRHQVKPKIKGEITRGKIRWRGLAIARLQEDDTFLGLMQRATFIEPDWQMIQMQTQLEDSLLFGISDLREKRDKAIEYFSGGIFEQIKKDV